MNVFVPTPTAESYAFLEVYALLNGHMTRLLDIVAVFLIEEDRGASKAIGCMCVRQWNGMNYSKSGLRHCHQLTGLAISIDSGMFFADLIEIYAQIGTQTQFELPAELIRCRDQRNI